MTDSEAAARGWVSLDLPTAGAMLTVGAAGSRSLLDEIDVVVDWIGHGRETCGATRATLAILFTERAGPRSQGAFGVATWEARKWIAGLMGLAPDDLAVRSIDRYGAGETQVRYERGNEAVARLTVSGPVLPMGAAEGGGTWVVKAQIGAGTEDTHVMELPEADEIIY